MEKIAQAIVKNAVKWTPSGVGLYGVAESIGKHDWKQAVLLSFATACSGVWVKFSGKFMEEAEKEAEKRGGSFARWMFVMGDRLAVLLGQKLAQIWRTLTSGFESKYLQRLIYICRNFETQGLDKDRVLKLQRVFVPLKISQKGLTQISPNLIQSLAEPANASGQREIGAFLALMGHDSAFRRLAILGAPGSGKTTLLRYLTLTYAHRQQRQLHSKAPNLIPVLIYLRDVRQDIMQSPGLDLAGLITTWMERLQSIDPLKPPSGWVAKQLREKRFLVLLDGLDEVADAQERQRVSQWVDRQMHEYPEVCFILTSRPFGYQSAQLQEDVTVLEVQPFTLKQMQQFIRNWYVETEVKSQEDKADLGVRQEAKQQADDLIERIRNSSPLVAMAVNPLLLTMIATVHRRGSALPGKRVELYKEICQVLLEKRQLAKRLPDLLSATQKQSVLQVLALDLMKQKIRSFNPTEAMALLQNRLENFSLKAVNPMEFLKQIQEISGLLIEKEEGIYEFAHLSFQEYLAATELKETQQENYLIEALRHPEQLSWWAETIRLYAAQSDATDLIRAALENCSVGALTLAYDCLEEGKSVNPTVRQHLEYILEAGLEDR
jgi:predicted NACHT family NTPase